MELIEKAIQGLLAREKLKAGAQGPSVALLQQYLLKYGFLVPAFAGRETLLYPNVQVDTGSIDVVTVAAHEIGHSLGLDHSQDRDGLMFPFYGGPRRDPADATLVRLAQDDLQGISALYS